MRSLKGSLLAVVLVVAACNPSSFDSILDHAPVLVTDTGGSSTGALFVLPLPPKTGATVAARALVTRSDKTYVATADYDVNGKVTLHEDTDAESSLNLGGSIYSTAIRADGTILLGIPGFGGGAIPPGRVSTAVPTQSADGSLKLTVAPILQGTSRLGISVAAGNITGSPAGDFVALGDNTVQLIPGSDAIPAPLSCQNVALDPPLAFAGNYGFRPIAVGNLLGDAADEIVLGGLLGSQGVVAFVPYDPVAHALLCPTKIFADPIAASFGTSVAIADFDGDGHADLAVGVPPNRVSIYFGPLDSSTAPDVTITNSTSTGFGKKIAPFWVTGMPSAQLLVADSSGHGGKGGELRVFTLSRATPALTAASATAVLFDANADSDSGMLGLSLGNLSFEGRICNPTTGALQAVPFASLGSKLLTFFAYAGGSPDPRCFAQAK